MSNSSPTRLTRDEFLVIINNYKMHGRDTTELEKALNETNPGSSFEEIPDFRARIEELRKQSPVTQGKCSICASEGTLRSGVCETCFESWAARIAEDNISRAKRDRERERKKR